MVGIHDEESRIDALRSRLYERGKPPVKRQVEPLQDIKEPAPATWEQPPHPKAPRPIEVAPTIEENNAPIMTRTNRNKYRIKVLGAALLFFVAALVISSAFLLLGNNSISGENISISINGPFTIGGGETLNLQIGITNSNDVPIQSATLIIEYPSGTKSDEESPRDLFIERVPLDSIKSGETINIPLKSKVFGEENSERTVEASIEYRVEGSNATFFKEAEPLRFKISSAPVVMRVAANTKASSGQETDITLIVGSNSQTTLKDVLVEAEYPVGYDFTTSDPSPFSGKNKWLIDTLEPGQQKTITIRGAVGGQTTDDLALHFKVGVPQEDDKSILATVFSTASTEFTLENPFLGLVLTMDNDTDGDIVAKSGQVISGEVAITNTLSDTIYDTVVNLVFAGNAVSDPAVSQTDGFYKSSENMITWDAASKDRLKEMRPGETVNLTFSFQPDENVVRTPSIQLAVDAKSRRVSENRVPEELRGSTKGEVRVTTNPKITTEARWVKGPIPPKTEQVTEYTVTVMVENGGNNINNSEMTFSIPPYITWEDSTSGPGTFNYNSNNRTVTWKPGDIAALGKAVAIMSLSLEPSISQIGDTPFLIGEQQFRTDDAYTGTVVRVSNEQVSAALPPSSGFETGNGRITE